MIRGEYNIFEYILAYYCTQIAFSIKLAEVAKKGRIEH